MDLNEDDVFQILKFIDESKFKELHLETKDLKLVVHKSDAGGTFKEPKTTAIINSKSLTVNKATHESVEQNVASLISAKTSEDQQIKRLDGAEAFEEEGLIPIKSPMLGIFYTAATPDDPPFVEVGTTIREKDTVCIIEVMKLFTSITAGIRGCIAKICAENGQMVQYDQVLFLVEPEKD